MYKTFKINNPENCKMVTKKKAYPDLPKLFHWGLERAKNNWIFIMINFISLFLFLNQWSLTPCILIYLYIKIPLISPCHRSPDNPSNQLLTYPKTYFDMCNQLYSVSLINFGPTTQNSQPWLGGSKLHS